MASDDITVEILRGIRDEVRGVRQDLGTRLDGLTGRADGLTGRVDGLTDQVNLTNERLDGVVQGLVAVQTTLKDLSAQQRFALRFMRRFAERQLVLEPRVADLEDRVEKLESK